MEAADVVHSDAMSERVASRNNDEYSPFNADPPILGSMYEHVDGSRSPAASEEVDQEGVCICYTTWNLYSLSACNIHSVQVSS